MHAVIDGDVPPEAALNAFKSYASRALNMGAPSECGRLRWARHGSTQYLWTPDQIDAAVRYVLEKQGETMAAWEGPG